MRSIKPGRGPSFMGGISSIAGAIFGVIWTISAASMGAPFFFPLFGIVFICLGIGSAVYNFKNATGKNRYSAFDIVDENEEPDPLNERFGGERKNHTGEKAGPAAFCPYCGAKADNDYRFCRSCGKAL